jgi:threonine dehydratase
MRLIGIQAELYPSMYNKLNGVDMPCAGDTLAEGIAVKYPGAAHTRASSPLVDDIVLVSERHLEEAVSLLLQIEKTVVEGAGAAGLAALLAHPEEFAMAQGRAGAVRRQYRYAPARECAVARSRAFGPHRASAYPVAGSSGRLVQGR